MQKLVVYNHLEGDPGLDVDGDNNSKLLRDVLNMVCGCVDNSTPDRYIYWYIENEHFGISES